MDIEKLKIKLRKLDNEILKLESERLEVLRNIENSLEKNKQQITEHSIIEITKSYSIRLLNDPYAWDLYGKRMLIRDQRLIKFDEKIKGGFDYDNFVRMIMNKYNSKEYREREFTKNREPMESLYYFLYDHAARFGDELNAEELSCYKNDFTVGIFKVGNYIYNKMNGQGGCIQVFDKRKFYTL